MFPQYSLSNTKKFQEFENIGTIYRYIKYFSIFQYRIVNKCITEEK